jgi:hypothetical protein
MMAWMDGWMGHMMKKLHEKLPRRPLLYVITRFSFVKIATFFKLLHHSESALFSIATKTSILKSLLPLVLHA